MAMALPSTPSKGNGKGKGEDHVSHEDLIPSDEYLHKFYSEPWRLEY